MNLERIPGLVMFTGSSLGSGKSTLSALLQEQLAMQSIPAIWLQEEHLDAIIAQYLPNWQINTVEPAAFLHACTALLAKYRMSDAVLITDSVLPGYINFFGRFPTASIERYNTALYQLLKPRDPLLIYLQSDVATALKRAITQRGEQWFENIRNYLNSWHLPLYTSIPKPFRSGQDVIAYFSALDRFSRDLVSQWPGPKQVLDTTQAALSDLLVPILRAFGCSFRPFADVVDPPRLADYAGWYVRVTASSAPEHLAIEIVSGQLRVNTYWPIGTVLLATGRDLFRLETTDRWLIFVRNSAGQIVGLRYRLSGQNVLYHLLGSRDTVL